MHIVKGRTTQEQEVVCIQKGGVVYNAHIFIPIFIFVYDYSFVSWTIVVIMGWVCFTVIMGNVFFLNL